MENYKEKYNAALERASKLRVQNPFDTVGQMVEHIFPELIEDEDEIMKREIVAYINELADLKNEKIPTKWLAWLEKQSDKIVDCPQNHQDVKHPNGGIVMEDFNGGEGFYKLHLDYLNKKQVEDIEEMVRTWNKESKTSNENIKNCIGMCLTDANEQRFKNYGTTLKDCLDWLEKQGEQPTDKIEPKFKVGDWVILNSTVAQILDKQEYGFVGLDTNGKDFFCNYGHTDSMRLWTINDAKDGDVLVTEDYIFIFKYILRGGVHIYCHYNFDDEEFDSDIPDAVIGNIRDKGIHFRPATKEQRDLFFSKMKEDGYEWDADKKKRIEQTNPKNHTKVFCIK